MRLARRFEAGASRHYAGDRSNTSADQAPGSRRRVLLARKVHKSLKQESAVHPAQFTRQFQWWASLLLHCGDNAGHYVGRSPCGKMGRRQNGQPELRDFWAQPPLRVQPLGTDGPFT